MSFISRLQKMKWPYLGSWAVNKKNKDTFFSSTFKVWESKVCLVFFIHGQGAKIFTFPQFDDGTYSTSGASIYKMAISQLYLEKLKTLCFLQLLKFERAKCPFFSIFERGLSYGQSINLQVFPFDIANWKMSTLRGSSKRLPKTLKIYMRHLFAPKIGDKNFQKDLKILMKNWTPYCQVISEQWGYFIHLTISSTLQCQ